MSELKPCPFCGDTPLDYDIEPHEHSDFMRALVPDVPDHAGSHVIECVCGAGMIDDTREAVLIRWNHRALTEAAAPAPAQDLTKLAQESGATVYRHRSDPHAPAVAFGDESWTKFCAALSAQPAPAEPSDAQMQKDAARYRWMRSRSYKEGRDGGWTGAFHFYPVPGWDDTPYSRERGAGFHHEILDAAIDAAMSKTAAEGAVDPAGVKGPEHG